MSEASVEKQKTYEQLVQAGQGFAQLTAQAEVRTSCDPDSTPTQHQKHDMAHAGSNKQQDTHGMCVFDG